MKHRLAELLPFVDPNALDAARFFYGTEDPLVEFFLGDKTLNALLGDAEADFDLGMPGGTYGEQVITEGKRNATLSLRAGKIVKRFGYTEEAHENILKEAEKCDPPLEEDELEKIWHSAARTADWARQQPGYVPPEEFNSVGSLKPDDYSDIGQAKANVTDCGAELAYTAGTVPNVSSETRGLTLTFRYLLFLVGYPDWVGWNCIQKHNTGIRHRMPK